MMSSLENQICTIRDPLHNPYLHNKYTMHNAHAKTNVPQNRHKASHVISSLVSFEKPCHEIFLCKSITFNATELVCNISCMMRFILF